MGIELYRCKECGAEVPIIPQILSLHGIIARNLLEERSPLLGEQIRFLRKHVGLTGRQFAEMLGIRPEYLSKVENGKHLLKRSSEKLARAILAALSDRSDGESLRDLLIATVASRVSDDHDLSGHLQFRLAGSAWRK